MNTTTIGRTNYFLTTDPKRLKELLEKNTKPQALE